MGTCYAPCVLISGSPSPLMLPCAGNPPASAPPSPVAGPDFDWHLREAIAGPASNEGGPGSEDSETRPAESDDKKQAGTLPVVLVPGAGVQPPASHAAGAPNDGGSLKIADLSPEAAKELSEWALLQRGPGGTPEGRAALSADIRANPGTYAAVFAAGYALPVVDVIVLEQLGYMQGTGGGGFDLAVPPIHFAGAAPQVLSSWAVRQAGSGGTPEGRAELANDIRTNPGRYTAVLAAGYGLPPGCLLQLEQMGYVSANAAGGFEVTAAADLVETPQALSSWALRQFGPDGTPENRAALVANVRANPGKYSAVLAAGYSLPMPIVLQLEGMASVPANTAGGLEPAAATAASAGVPSPVQRLETGTPESGAGLDLRAGSNNATSMLQIDQLGRIEPAASPAASSSTAAGTVAHPGMAAAPAASAAAPEVAFAMRMQDQPKAEALPQPMPASVSSAAAGLNRAIAVGQFTQDRSPSHQQSGSAAMEEQPDPASSPQIAEASVRARAMPDSAATALHPGMAAAQAPSNSGSVSPSAGEIRQEPLRDLELPPEPIERAAGERVHSLKLRVESPAGRHAQVNVAERGGEVRVVVRSADGAVRESLRDGLSDLVRRLENSGYQLETWKPSQTGSSLQRDSAEGSAGNADHRGQRGGERGGYGGSGRQDHAGGRQGDRPRWIEEVERSMAGR